jgi:hypothetical protein
LAIYGRKRKKYRKRKEKNSNCTKEENLISKNRKNENEKHAAFSRLETFF